ncbi:TPA: DUF551 domain-containing protein [Escherichia coli]|nr:DUF551 domain-containing protein [Escherichia coli]HDW9010097.1 DUF551 domain-containing protein [Escherichia coli]HDW9012845.1 DUF551 domain-containing protein [Escherichia coli]HDW9052784.1 DUF551 domain-containing protein [Escherichia coli]
MTTFTDKELIKEIKERISSLDVRDNIERRAYEIALASLEVEPIGFRCRRNDNLGDWSYVYHREPDDFERKHLVIEGIYAAPPAQVVPEEKPMPNPLSMYAVDAVAAIAEVRGWNACRAAMLQAEPVSNSDELPLDYLQGHKDGLEWAAQLAEANHPQTGDWLYDDPIDLARAIRKGPDMPTVQAGNYPGTPDGWISCSELMPDDGQHVIILCDGAFVLYAQYRDGEFFDIVRNGDEFFETQSRNVTHWMPLPEPPQEAK